MNGWNLKITQLKSGKSSEANISLLCSKLFDEKVAQIFHPPKKVVHENRHETTVSFSKHLAILRSKSPR